MKVVAFDTEFHLSQPGLEAPPLVCGSWADENGAHICNRDEILARFHQAIRTEHIVGCNLAADLVVLCAADPSLVELVFEAADAGRLHDISIREALVDIYRGELDDDRDTFYSLALLASRHLGLDLYKDKKGADSWRKRYALLDGVPVERYPWAARVYPIRDAWFTFEIFQKQEGGKNLHDEWRHVNASFALQLASVWGMRTNRERVAALKAKLEIGSLEREKHLRKIGVLRDDDTRNMTILKELVTRAYHGDPPRTKPSGKFPDGQVATDRDTLLESGDPDLKVVGTTGRNDKYLTTYVPILEQGLTVPWNPYFTPVKATTRISSNAQQFPKQGGVRECFETRPGYLWCSVDVGGGELRTMSQVAINRLRYSKMAESLNAKRDVHAEVAGTILRISYEEARAGYKAKDRRLCAFRDLGKIWNFGKAGGMGAKTMVYNSRGKSEEETEAPDGFKYSGIRFCILAGVASRCGLKFVPAWVQGKERRVCAKCVEVAEQIDRAWLQSWPEQAELIQEAKRRAHGDSRCDVVIPWGNIVRGECSYSQGLNTPFQGLLALIMKVATTRTSREMYANRRSPLYGSRLDLNIHDELLAELLADRFGPAADRMAAIIREEMCNGCPDLVKSVEAEPAVARIWTKSMDTKRDAAGNLLVWEPEPKKAA